MAIQHDNTSTRTKQFHSHIEDQLKSKISQLEGIIDLLAVALHPSNSNENVFKKDTLHDSVWLIEDLVIEIKDLVMNPRNR